MAPASDYDGAWKYALEQYFAPFLEQFFPDAYADINWSVPVRFNDAELLQLAPDKQTGKKRVDKLVQVQQRSGNNAYL